MNNLSELNSSEPVNYISPTVNSKYIISFDIGIKHLCYCILKTEPRLDIVDWNIINLMEDPQQQLMNIYLIILFKIYHLNIANTIEKKVIDILKNL